MTPQKGAKVTKSKIDDLVKSLKAPVIVIPVKTGIQENHSRRSGDTLDKPQ